MSNEENDDYMASLSQAQTAEDEVDGGGGGREAAGSNESVLGGQTMPQISPNAPLEGNVSPPPTQPHLDDNLHNGNMQQQQHQQARQQHQREREQRQRQQPQQSCQESCQASGVLQLPDPERPVRQ